MFSPLDPRPYCVVVAGRRDDAVQTGHADVVRWLLRNRTERCPANRNILDWVANHGHLKVIKVLHEARVEGCSARAMNWAAKNGHLETLIWLHENRAEVCVCFYH